MLVQPDCEKDDSDYLATTTLMIPCGYLGRLGRRVSGRKYFTSLRGRPLLLRHRGRPARHDAVSKTSGGAGTQPGHTDHADEPHNRTDSPYTSSRSPGLCRNMLLENQHSRAHIYGGMWAAAPGRPRCDRPPRVEDDRPARICLGATLEALAPLSPRRREERV